MPRFAQQTDESFLLEAALEGLELQRTRIEGQIEQIRARLGHAPAGRRGRPAKKAAEAPVRKTGKRRQLSPEARKRIAAAQKKRWAAFRKQAANAST